MSAAAPLPAASASVYGRSAGVNSRPQPYAFSAWARSRSSPLATSNPGCPFESGQVVVAKCRAASSVRVATPTPDPSASVHRPNRER